jgi:hypothetical protein
MPLSQMTMAVPFRRHELAAGKPCSRPIAAALPSPAAVGAFAGGNALTLVLADPDLDHFPDRIVGGPREPLAVQLGSQVEPVLRPGRR